MSGCAVVNRVATPRDNRVLFQDKRLESGLGTMHQVQAVFIVSGRNHSRIGCQVTVKH